MVSDDNEMTYLYADKILKGRDQVSAILVSLKVVTGPSGFI